MIRLSWSQPEDLVPHALAAAQHEGRDVGTIRARWRDAGGAADAAVSGATAQPATAELRSLARLLLVELDRMPVPTDLAAREPDDLEGIRRLAPGGVELPAADDSYLDRVHGAWLGRAAGCLLGKPVEKIPREGIRLIAQGTGNWPIASYFTEVGLDPGLAARYPWNRRSRPTSLAENIDGMPEDDDLNFPLLALGLLETVGRSFTVDDVAQSWLANLPGGRVFTAERIAYRNLLDGIEPEFAAEVGNPFRDWIGAQIRADLYGWVAPGDPQQASGLAWRDARLSHRRGGVYGAMFVAAASSAAVVGAPIARVIEAGLSVVPPQSRYAAAIRRGAELGASDLDDEAALNALYADFGHLHWVHAENNSALIAYALVRSRGDFTATITRTVTGGWDTDSASATAGAIAGALSGADHLPAPWIAPLRNRLATTVPGFDGIGFDELARRTAGLA